MPGRADSSLTVRCNAKPPLFHMVTCQIISPTLSNGTLIIETYDFVTKYGFYLAYKEYKQLICLPL
jgi:hypothetical protein